MIERAGDEDRPLDRLAPCRWSGAASSKRPDRAARRRRSPVASVSRGGFTGAILPRPPRRSLWSRARAAVSDIASAMRSAASRRDRSHLRRIVDRRVRTDPQQETRQPRRLADREPHPYPAVAGLFDRTRPGSSPQPTRPTRGGATSPAGRRRAGGRPRRERGSTPRPSKRSPVGRTARMRSTRKRRLSPARWHHASTYHSPSAKKTVVGSMRLVVSSSRPRRPVVDLQPLVALGGAAHRLEVLGRVDRHVQAGKVECGFELLERGRERAARIRARAPRAARGPRRAGRDPHRDRAAAVAGSSRRAGS